MQDKQKKELSLNNLISIIVEVIGLILLIPGIYFEYIYVQDKYAILISVGSFIFALGSGFVKKFPWSYINLTEDKRVNNKYNYTQK